eukprot:1972954-Pyramimonas_sp.AAC.1
MDSSPMWLPSDTRRTLQRFVRTVLLGCQHMSSWALSNDVAAWDLRPKHHYLDRDATNLDVLPLNWNVTACWDSEKWLGKLKMCGKATHSAKAVGLRGLQRYVACLKVRFKNRGAFNKPVI